VITVTEGGAGKIKGRSREDQGKIKGRSWEDHGITETESVGDSR
jgi:hypothetical protein